MNTPDKCPHCGTKFIGRFDGMECYDCGTGGQVQSDLCRERASHGKPTDEPNPNGSTNARLNWWRDRGDALSDELAALRKELSNATDTLDMMRDEFQRIVARMVEDGMIIKDVGQEILGICKRARSDIAQRLPVIAQRDAAESRVRELEVDAASWEKQAEQRLDDANEFGRKWEEAKADAESWRQQSERFEKQLLASDARVRKLEGLASQVVKSWKSFDLAEGDWERTDTERALSQAIDTLGEAMPRKEEK